MCSVVVVVVRANCGGGACARVGVHTVHRPSSLTLRLLALKNGIDEFVDNPRILLFGLRGVPRGERGARRKVRKGRRGGMKRDIKGEEGGRRGGREGKRGKER